MGVMESLYFMKLSQAISVLENAVDEYNCITGEMPAKIIMDEKKWKHMDAAFRKVFSVGLPSTMFGIPIVEGDSDPKYGYKLEPRR